jgi:cytoskeletal protein RodZ
MTRLRPFSFVTFLVALLLAFTTIADAGQKTVHVKGYTKKDGTHVAAHERKAPKSSGGETTSSTSKQKHGETSSTSTETKSKATTPTTSSSGVARDKNGRIARSGTAKHDFEKASGYPHGRKGYIVDHIIPLACGGADVPSNMQWQTTADAKTKDKVERRGCS